MYNIHATSAVESSLSQTRLGCQAGHSSAAMSLLSTLWQAQRRNVSADLQREMGDSSHSFGPQRAFGDLVVLHCSLHATKPLHQLQSWQH